MTTQELKVFENKKIRSVWDDTQDKWLFSVIDIVEALTDSPDAKRYWSVLKVRLKKEGVEPTTICSTFKLVATDGKRRFTDVANVEQVLRIIQSIPSKKAEPLKHWLALVGSERIHQMQDPELGIQQSLQDYKRLGYSDNWINQRLKSILGPCQNTLKWLNVAVPWLKSRKRPLSVKPERRS